MSLSHLLETDGFNQLAKGNGCYYLYNQNDVYVGQSIEKYGEFSALEMALLKQLCAPGDAVIDAGANIGAHTIWLAKQVGNEGRVIAFEPQRLVFQTLCANVALNSLENVDCYLAALGETDGAILVPELDPRQRSNFGGLGLENMNQGMEVPCLTLDRFIAIPKLKLIKIDVEGMEAEVIKGGLQLIEKFKPFLYLENDRVEKSEALMTLIDSLGYRMFWHTPFLFNPDNFYKNSENIYPTVVSCNLLCVHRDSDMAIESQEITDFTFHPFRT
jgi:FkbM family methyltransferase